MFPKFAISIRIECNGFEPAQITSKFGLIPKESWKCGDTNLHTRIVQKTSYWGFEIQKMDCIYLGSAIRDLISKISVCGPEEIEAFTSGLGATVSIFCAIYCYDEVPSMCLDPDIINFVSRLHAGIDIDFYAMRDSTG